MGYNHLGVTLNCFNPPNTIYLILCKYLYWAKRFLQFTFYWFKFMLVGGLFAWRKEQRRWKYVCIKPSLQYLSQINDLKLIIMKNSVPNLDLNAHSSTLQRKSRCTVLFLGIHKWESDIYIGLSPALHLKCISFRAFSFYSYFHSAHSPTAPIVIILNAIIQKNLGLDPLGFSV